MRNLLVVLFFMTTLLCSSQEISLSLNNPKWEEILKRIESQSEYKFAYDSTFKLTTKSNLNLKFTDASLEDVIAYLQKNTNYNFKILGKNITITAKQNQSSKEQAMTVEGTVYDEAGTPLPGVSVMIKNTTVGVSTGFDGKYGIEARKGNILVFQYMGFTKQEVMVDGNQLDVTLKENVESLDEVVVVGFATQKKVDLTGAVTSVKGDEIVEKPMSDVRQALQGVVPGLTIIDRGGSPGNESLSFNIRGLSSVSANTSPLILIDGIQSDITQINPNDIESISVLKDAASASIYGARAANGVVLITTKRGAQGEYKVDYHGYAGVQTPATLPEAVTAEQYLRLVNEALVNAGRPEKYSEEYIQNTIAGTDPINYPYVNLFEELYKDGFIQNHSFAVRGGNEGTKIAVSANYLDQEGMLKNTRSTKTGGRLNGDFKLKDYARLRTDIYYNKRKSLTPNRYGDAIGAIVGTSPVTVLQYPNGVYGLNKDNTNALAALEKSGMNQSFNEDFSVNLGLDIDLIEGLTLKTDYSYLRSTYRYKNFRASYNFRDPNDISSIVYRWTPNQLVDGRDESGQWNFKSILNYDLNLDNHQFNFLGGIDVIENKRNRIWASRQNIYNEETPELNLGDVTSEKNGGYSEDWSLFSYLGRVNYSFKNKYLFEGNIRYDGSSRFGDGHKWGVFPSFSAGWRISEEAFIDSIEWINNLKLRGSWGQLGNQNIGLYRFSSTIYSNYPYSFNDNEVDGFSQRYYANENITWETTEMTDFGLDIGLFNNKIDIVFDWFIKDTDDMLLTLPISPLVGLDPSELNIGSVRNEGWEFAINYNGNINTFNYSIGFNISQINNTLTDFGGNEPSINNWFILKEGEAINSFYGYKSDGLFQSQEEIDTHPTQPNHASLKPGDIKLVDLNDDGVINSDDRAIIGSNIPKYQYGVNLGASFKGFDLNLFFQGAYQVDNYLYGAPNEGPAYEIFTTTRVLDRWTPDNTDASFPRLEAASNKNNYLFNDFWLRDASYLRLKNLQLGYSLPESVIGRMNVDKIRLYFGGTNVFTITDVESGLDPETLDGRPSYYPPVSTYTLGLQLTF